MSEMHLSPFRHRPAASRPKPPATDVVYGVFKANPDKAFFFDELVEVVLRAHPSLKLGNVRSARNWLHKHRHIKHTIYGGASRKRYILGDVPFA
jgi:hypothetical protein